LPVFEVRGIKLDANELLRAIAEMPGLVRSFGIHEVHMERVAFHPGRAEVEFFPGDKTEKVVAFGNAALMALVLAWCKRIRVPIPQQCTKVIEVTHSGVTLCISLQRPSGQRRR
jgi:hypothetical protein